MTENEYPPGRLYVEYNCGKCGKVFVVHLLYATYKRAADGELSCRPPCPSCDCPGVLPKNGRLLGAFDGGKGTPATVQPYDPEAVIPPPKRFG